MYARGVLAQALLERSALGSANPARTEPPLLVPAAHGRGGGGRGSGGGAGTATTSVGFDHIVFKRIVEQSARLAEQATQINQLEAMVNVAHETSSRIRAEVSHMPQKIGEQLTSSDDVQLFGR